MPEVPVGFAQMTARLQLAGDLEPMSTGIGIRLIDSTAMTQAQANAAAAPLITMLRAAITSQYSVTNVNVFAGLTIGDVSFDVTTGLGAGAVTGDSTPQNTSFLVRKSGALAGRRHRGRMYVPSIRDNQVNDTGGVLSGEQVRLQGLVDTLFASRNTNTTYDEFVILHSYGDATLPTVITAMKIDPVVATQRRRLRR